MRTERRGAPWRAARRKTLARLLPLLLAAAGAFIAPPALAQDPGARDALLNARIVGIWVEGDSPFTVATFARDGGYEARVYRSPESQELLLTARGTWWIKGGLLYNEIQRVMPPLIRPGAVYIDLIVDITPDTMILVDEAGRQYQKRRVR